MGGDDKNVLSKYTGFGGLGFVLNPLDRKAWTKTDMECYEDTVRLHEVLSAASSDEREYNAWVESLKASTLTAYYTPEVLITEAMNTICGQDTGLVLKNILDPAAGSHGKFALIAGYDALNNHFYHPISTSTIPSLSLRLMRRICFRG